MPRIIILVVGLILLIGAAVGGWFAYTTFGPQLLGAKEEKPAEPPPPPPPRAPRFVRLPPMTIPVLGAKRVEQFVTFQVVLAVDDEGVAQSLQGQMPRLIDAFLTTLYVGLSDGTLLDQGLINLTAVKAKLMRASAKVLGKDVVKEALVQMVLQRNL